MSVRKDITGQKFGKLTAIKPVDSSSDGTLRWLCKCECGETVVACGGRLRAGTKKHCGCSTPDFTRPRKRRTKLTDWNGSEQVLELQVEDDIDEVLKCLG